MTTPSPVKRTPAASAISGGRMAEHLWPSVLDMVEGWMHSDGLEIADVKERLSAGDWRKVLTKEEVEEVEPRLRRLWKERLAKERAQKEIEPALRVSMERDEVPRVQESGVFAMMADAFSTILGVGVAQVKTRWRSGPSRVLHEGDDATMIHGQGRDWLLCAVRITRANGEEEILPEHRIRARSRKPCPGYKGRRLYLQVLEADVTTRGHDPQVLMRRLAAWTLAYFGPRSGMRDMSELGQLNGVTRQAVHQQMEVIRKVHRRRTGEEQPRIGGSAQASGMRRGCGGARRSRE